MYEILKSAYVIGDVMDSGADDPEGDSREDVGVVALAGFVDLSVHLEVGERRSSKEKLYNKLGLTTRHYLLNSL